MWAPEKMSFPAAIRHIMEGGVVCEAEGNKQVLVFDGTLGVRYEGGDAVTITPAVLNGEYKRVPVAITLEEAVGRTQKNLHVYDVDGKRMDTEDTLEDLMAKKWYI